VSLGHPSKFQQVSCLGFVTAPTSLNRGQPNLAQCLAISCTGIVYIHFWRLLPLNGILPAAKFTLHPSLAFPILAALLHGTRALASAKVCGMVQGMELWIFRRGRHLYSAGRPSYGASAHILVVVYYTVRNI